MERLRTRQRLAKMTDGTPSMEVDPTFQSVPDVSDGHLAAKIRVSSLINQSIPDMSYAPRNKGLSKISKNELEDFQLKETTPLEIDGKIYRMHPASIPEPDFDERDLDIERDNEDAMTQRNAIPLLLQEIAEAESVLPVVRNALQLLRQEYNNVASLASLAPVEQFNEIEREFLMQLKELEDQEEEIILFIQNKKTEIDTIRNALEQFDTELPERIRKDNQRKIANKAKLVAYEDNLKTLNRTYNLTQNAGETDDDYVARIREQTTGIEDPNLLIDRFNLYEARRFRDNMKDIIRDTSVIEIAYNTLYKEDPSIIIEVNKLFENIKTRYQRLYGTFQLKDVDLIRFLKQMIVTPDEEEDVAGQGQDYSSKYKALNKGRRFTITKLVESIITVFDFIYSRDNQPFSFDYNGSPTVLSKGVRTGYYVRTANSTRALQQTSKPILLSLYVNLLETLKVMDPAIYQDINEQINTVTKGEYGEGFEDLPKSCSMGKLDIDLNKLFYKNILSCKHHGMKINGLKNTPVSDAFVKIIMELCKGKYPSTKDLNTLQGNENQTFDAILHLAGLHKRVEHTASKSIEKLKQRLTLIEGEITAGNTNRDIFSEAKEIVFKLHHLGEITQNSANDYLKQLKL